MIDSTSANATIQEENNNFVFVGGLKASFTKPLLFKYFNSLGDVDSIDLKMKKNSQVNRGFCIVKFMDKKSAQRVLQVKEHYIKRRLVSCRPYLKGEKLKKSKVQKNNKKLYISGLPEETQNSQITQLFEKFGKVETGYTLTDLETGKSKGFGFVSFEEEGVIEKVLKAKNSLIILGTLIIAEKYGAHRKPESEKNPSLKAPELSKNINKKLAKVQKSSFTKKQNPGLILQNEQSQSNFRNINPYYVPQSFPHPQNQQNFRPNRRNLLREKLLKQQKIVNKNGSGIRPVPHHPSFMMKTLEDHQMCPTQTKYHRNQMNNISKSWHDLDVSNLKLRLGRSSLSNF